MGVGITFQKNLFPDGGKLVYLIIGEILNGRMVSSLSIRYQVSS